MSLATLIGQALLGWLAADLIAGIVHWLEDRVLSPRTIGLGRIILAQRRHHAVPHAFAAGSLVARNGTTWLAAGAVSVVWAVAFGSSVTWGFATLGGMLASQAHFYAHSPREAGSLVRLLQEIGLLQSAKHHAGHHRSPHATRFCPLTDFLNPLLDRLDAWARLERLLGIPQEQAA